MSEAVAWLAVALWPRGGRGRGASGSPPRYTTGESVNDWTETSSGTLTVNVPAVPTRNTGEYRATLVLPRPGSWMIRIDTVEFNDSALHELAAIAPGSPAPAPLPQPALGERLVVAKGCIGCHLNDDVQLQARSSHIARADRGALLGRLSARGESPAGIRPAMHPC